MRVRTTWAVVVLAVLLVCGQPSSAISAGERAALDDLLNAVGSPVVLAGARPGWGSDRDPCDRWKGVVCIIPGGTAGKGAPVVSELLLSGLGLKGVIPESISGLKHLRHLYLNDNELTGTIPASIGELSDLEHLSLGNNDLEGGIPGGIFGLERLQWVFLHGNRLEGTLPASLADAPAVEVFDVHGNKGLSGPVPNLGAGSWSNGRAVTNLNLADTGLDGSLAFVSGLDLRRFNVSSTALTGTIPSQVCAVPVCDATMTVLFPPRHECCGLTCTTCKTGEEAEAEAEAAAQGAAGQAGEQGERGYRYATGRVYRKPELLMMVDAIGGQTQAVVLVVCLAAVWVFVILTSKPMTAAEKAAAKRKADARKLK